MTATKCTMCGGWGCFRCERADDVRRQLDVARAELAAANETIGVMRSTFEQALQEGEQWKRRYEALVCASRGVGYE